MASDSFLIISDTFNFLTLKSSKDIASSSSHQSRFHTKLKDTFYVYSAFLRSRYTSKFKSTHWCFLPMIENMKSSGMKIQSLIQKFMSLDF